MPKGMIAENENTRVIREFNHKMTQADMLIWSSDTT